MAVSPNVGAVCAMLSGTWRLRTLALVK